MNILSIQSHVSYGHVGNSAAVFCLQILGYNTWPIPTVFLSNHPGHSSSRGNRLTAKTIQDLILGLSDLGVLHQCDAVVSGYFSDPEISRVIVDTVAEIKSKNPSAIYLCDPVMGNNEKGLYVTPQIPKAIASDLLPIADIITPNCFELEQLSGKSITKTDDTANALQEITGQGPTIAICTSAPPRTPNKIAVIGSQNSTTWIVETSRQVTAANGRGDCFSAIFLAHYLSSNKFENSLSLAVSSVHDLIKMAGATSRDLPLVDGQKCILQPTEIFPPQLI